MKKGFTVIEILIVITVTSLLAGSIIVSTTNTRKRSRDSKRKADLLAIQSALEVYYSQNKYYPTNCAAGLGDGVNSASQPVRIPSDWSGGEKEAMWPNLGQWINHAPRISLGKCTMVGIPQFTTTYISALPQDPINSGAYIYRYRTDSSSNPARSYELDAKLELDQGVMATDGGGCPGSNGVNSRYELFNLNGDTLLKTCL